MPSDMRLQCPTEETPPSTRPPSVASSSASSGTPHRSTSMDSLHTNASGFEKPTGEEFIPTRMIKATPKANALAMQFVKTGPANLHKSAKEQMKKADAVKSLRKTSLQEEEEWQSNTLPHRPLLEDTTEWQANLDKWKSSRRKRNEDVLERVIEVKRNERDEEFPKTRRKSKTFSEMRDEKNKRGRRYNLVIHDDDNNDLGDLGLQTPTNGVSSVTDPQEEVGEAKSDAGFCTGSDTGSDGVFAEDNISDTSSALGDKREIHDSLLDSRSSSVQREAPEEDLVNGDPSDIVSSQGGTNKEAQSSVQSACSVKKLPSSSVSSEYTYDKAIEEYKQFAENSVKKRNTFSLTSLSTNNGLISTIEKEDSVSCKLISTPTNKEMLRISDKFVDPRLPAEKSQPRALRRDRNSLAKIDISKRRSMFELRDVGKESSEVTVSSKSLSHRKSIDISNTLRNKVASFENISSESTLKSRSGQKLLKDSKFKEKLASFSEIEKCNRIQDQIYRKTTPEFDRNFYTKLRNFNDLEENKSSQSLERKAQTRGSKCAQTAQSNKGNLLKDRIASFESSTSSSIKDLSVSAENLFRGGASPVGSLKQSCQSVTNLSRRQGSTTSLGVVIKKNFEEEISHKQENEAKYNSEIVKINTEDSESMLLEFGSQISKLPTNVIRPSKTFATPPHEVSSKLTTEAPGVGLTSLGPLVPSETASASSESCLYSGVSADDGDVERSDKETVLGEYGDDDIDEVIGNCENACEAATDLGDASAFRVSSSVGQKAERADGWEDARTEERHPFYSSIHRKNDSEGPHESQMSTETTENSVLNPQSNSQSDFSSILNYDPTFADLEVGSVPWIEDGDSLGRCPPMPPCVPPPPPPLEDEEEEEGGNRPFLVRGRVTLASVPGGSQSAPRSQNPSSRPTVSPVSSASEDLRKKMSAFLGTKPPVQEELSMKPPPDVSELLRQERESERLIVQKQASLRRESPLSDLESVVVPCSDFSSSSDHYTWEDRKKAEVDLDESGDQFEFQSKLAELELEMEKHDRNMMQRIRPPPSPESSEGGTESSPPTRVVVSKSHQSSSASSREASMAERTRTTRTAIEPKAPAPSSLPFKPFYTAPSYKRVEGPVSGGTSVSVARKLEDESLVRRRGFIPQSSKSDNSPPDPLASCPKKPSTGALNTDPSATSCERGRAGPTEPPSAVPRKQSILALSAIPRTRRTDGDSWITKRKQPDAARHKDYSKHWLIQEAEQRRLEQQERITRPTEMTGIRCSTESSLSCSSLTQSKHLNSHYNRSQQHSTTTNSSLYNHPSITTNSPCYHPPTTTQTTPPPPQIVSEIRRDLSNSSFGSSDSTLSLASSNSYSSNTNLTNNVVNNTNLNNNNNNIYNNVSKFQKPTKTYSPPQESPPAPASSKPLPDAIISTITQRLQNKNKINARSRGDSRPLDDYSDYANTEAFSSAHLSNGIVTPPTIVEQEHLPSQQNHAQQAQTKDDQCLLSVSGKKKCSHCSEELGRGAAMIIESLRLFYHIPCFKCCVCGVQLGNGTSGADVRVRNHKLHCHNCYSNDEGMKFSKV